MKTGLVMALLGLIATSTHAGVFAIPKFVSQRTYSAGIEPELVLAEPASLGINAKLQYGLAESWNVGGAIGNGGGARGFRVGTYSVFDLFPDIEGQPGIGLAGQAYYNNVNDEGQFELTAIPYLHKALVTEGIEFDPFVAIPMGTRFGTQAAGGTKAVVSLNVGSRIKQSNHLHYVLEIGVAVQNTDTTMSGGFVYTP